MMTIDRTASLLVILLVILVAANAWWAGPARGGPQHWDSAIHLSESLAANRVFDGGTAFTLKALLNISWYYPPLVSYASVPFYRVFGESESTGILTMTFFLALLVLSVFFLGKHLFSSLTGLLAAAFTASFPIVIEFSRVFMLDLPLMAMVAFFVLLLVKSENFDRLSWSIAAGAAFGAGELTKWTFFFFVIFPLAYFSWKGLRGTQNRRKTLLTLLASALAGLVVMAPWYALHIVQILTSRGGELGRGDYTLMQSVFLYLQEMPGSTSWPLAIVLGAGIVLFCAGGRKWGSFLGLWFLSAYVILSITNIKAPRFAMPLLIPAALAAASGLTSTFPRMVRSPILRGWIAPAAFGITVAQMILVFLVPPAISADEGLGMQILGTPFIAVHGPEGKNWDNTAVLRPIVRDMEGSGRLRANVRVIPDYPYLNNSTASYYALLHRLPLQISGTSGFPMFTDYILLKSADIGPDSPDKRRESLTKEILEGIDVDSTAFREIARVTLPDLTTAIVVKIVPAQAPGAHTGAILSGLRESASRWVARYFRAPVGSSLTVGEYDSRETSRGHVRSIRVSMATAEFGDFAFNDRGIAVSGVDMEIDDVVFDPRAVVERKKLDVYSIGGINVKGIRIKQTDIMHFLSVAPVKGLEVNDIAIGDGTIALQGRLTKYDLGVDLAVRLSPEGSRNIRFELRRAKFGFLSLPVTPLNILTDAYNPLIRGLDNIGHVELGALTLESNELRIGGTDGNR